MDLGEKIVSIRGTGDKCTITFDNGNVLKGSGEILIDGFCIYKESLDLTPEEIDKLREMIKQKAMTIKNPMKLIID